MKFKKYINESCKESKLTLEEGFDNPDRMFTEYHPADSAYDDIENAIANKDYAKATELLDEFEAELDEIESKNATKKLFKFPKFIIDGQRRVIEKYRKQIPMEESLNDMSRRCEECNTLLNDAGTCPKCDDGEEDYGDKEVVEEALSVRDKLLRAYPELNFDKSADSENMTEEIQTEELSNREKLLRAFPELNFENSDTVTESVANEELSNKEKLKRAYPKLNFDGDIQESIDPEDDYAEYDDDYDFDDVEEDRRHAALYGGDRMYCDCGHKLAHNEYGSYCPSCEPQDPEEVYEDTRYDDEI